MPSGRAPAVSPGQRHPGDSDTIYSYGDGRRDDVQCGPGIDHAFISNGDYVSKTCEVVKVGKPD